jgi:hypothetical protein
MMKRIFATAVFMVAGSQAAMAEGGLAVLPAPLAPVVAAPKAAPVQAVLPQGGAGCWWQCSH